MVKKRKFGMANSQLIYKKMIRKSLAEQAKEFLGLKKLKKLRHCIQYADDEKKGDTFDCKRLEFKNFHDYKRYKPSDCNKDMVNFFVKGVGSRNKGKTTNKIIREMNNGNCVSPYVFNKLDSNKPIETREEIFLKKQQKLVPRILNPQTNLKGLLVYHGLGSGKTGTSIIVGEACKHISTNGIDITKKSGRSHNKVLVVVPASLKEQYKQEILGNLISRYKTRGTTNIKEKEKIIKEIKKFVKNFKKEKDIFPDKQRIINCFKIKGNKKINNSFSKNVLIKIKEKYIPQEYNSTNSNVAYNEKQFQNWVENNRLQKVNNTYKVISRQTFMKHFLISNETYKNGMINNKTGTGYCIKNFLKKPNGLLIIDEIQNLISETGSWYKNLIRGIKYYCHPTTKILLLTATPIYDKIFELGLTINLLNPRIRFPENRVDFDRLFVATSEYELKDEEDRNNSTGIKERKSIFSTEESRRERYAQTLHRDIPPREIKERFDSLEKFYKKLVAFLLQIRENAKSGLISIVHLIDDIKNEEIKNFIQILIGRESDIEKLTFITLFYLSDYLKKLLGLNDYRNSVIKNKDLFEYMCSGYISYFKGGNPLGFPKKITKIIDCKMSDVQANAYISIVKMEVKKNRDAEASKKINPNSMQQGTYFQKATMVSNVFLTHTAQAQDENKRRKELITEILKVPALSNELREQLVTMSVYDLIDLLVELNEDVDTVHEPQSKEEKKSEKDDVEDIKEIVKKGSKNKLKTILDERKRMTKDYYEATLKVIRDELMGIESYKDKIRKIHIYSCKFARMIDNILIEENGKGKHFIYSRFKTRGVECLSYMLEAFDYKRYDEETISELKKMMENDDIPTKKCFVVWSGDIMNKIEFSKNFKSIYNHPKNRKGEYLQIVLGTESIMEGVDLKEVKYVHITEPWWNESRMDQVMGRAIRWKSHIKMDTDDQKVIIYRYYALTQLQARDFAPDINPIASNALQTTLTNDALRRLNLNPFQTGHVRENINFAIHQLENPDPISPLAFSSIDRYVQRVAEKKKRLNQMFYKSIKNSSIDCLFNKFGNTYRLETEFYYNSDRDFIEYYYDPTEHKYYSKNKEQEFTKEIYGNEVEIKPKEGGKNTLTNIENNKEIYYENIECNSSTQTGKIFEEFFKNNKFYHLLNTEHHNKIKEIIFKIYKELNETEINRIKIKLQNCLKEKVFIKNPEANTNNLNKIFRQQDKKSPKAKIIENIILALRDRKRMKKIIKKFLSIDNYDEISQNRKDEFETNISKEIEQDLEKFRVKLWQISSLTYLKDQEKFLGIDKEADKSYKKFIQKLNKQIAKEQGPSNNSITTRPRRRIRPRGRIRRGPTQSPDDTFGNTSNFDPNAPSFVPGQNFDRDDHRNWVGSIGWDNPG